jgi:hypothetical protein
MAAIEAGPYLLAVAGSAASRRTLVLGPDSSLAALILAVVLPLSATIAWFAPSRLP